MKSSVRAGQLHQSYFAKAKAIDRAYCGTVEQVERKLATMGQDQQRRLFFAVHFPSVPLKGKLSLFWAGWKGLGQEQMQLWAGGV